MVKAWCGVSVLGELGCPEERTREWVKIQGGIFGGSWQKYLPVSSGQVVGKMSQSQATGSSQQAANGGQQQVAQPAPPQAPAAVLDANVQAQVDALVRQRLEQALGSVFTRVLGATERAARQQRPRPRPTSRTTWSRRSRWRAGGQQTERMS